MDEFKFHSVVIHICASCLFFYILVFRLRNICLEPSIIDAIFLPLWCALGLVCLNVSIILFSL